MSGISDEMRAAMRRVLADAPLTPEPGWGAWGLYGGSVVSAGRGGAGVRRVVRVEALSCSCLRCAQHNVKSAREARKALAQRPPIWRRLFVTHDCDGSMGVDGTAPRPRERSRPFRCLNSGRGVSLSRFARGLTRETAVARAAADLVPEDVQ